MTEPSKEAAEALAQVMYAEPGNDPERKIAIAGLAAALPIELEKARNRWEQEVRERLMSDEALDAMIDAYWNPPKEFLPLGFRDRHRAARAVLLSKAGLK